MKLTKSDAEKREEKKWKISLFFFFVSIFLSLFIEQNGTYIYTKGIFSLLKGKTHTHTLFKLDNEALMYDRHEMMRDFYCTNQYLEKIVDYPRK
jgi:hypothetical protein